MGLHPIVDEAACHAGVEGKNLPVGGNGGKVGDPAQVQHGERLRQIMGQRTVIYGEQRRALPACRDIGAAQVRDDRDAECPRQGGAVADLPGPAPFGTMGHGMAMEADDGNVLRHMAAAGQQVRYRLDMKLGQFLLDRVDERFETRPLHRHGALTGFGKAKAEALAIGHGVESDALAGALAIGFYQRGVYAVARCSRHQAYCEHR